VKIHELIYRDHFITGALAKTRVAADDKSKRERAPSCQRRQQIAYVWSLQSHFLPLPVAHARQAGGSGWCPGSMQVPLTPFFIADEKRKNFPSPMKKDK